MKRQCLLSHIPFRVNLIYDTLKKEYLSDQHMCPRMWPTEKGAQIAWNMHRHVYGKDGKKTFINQSRFVIREFSLEEVPF